MRHLHRRMPGRGDLGGRHLCNRSRQVHRLRHLRRRLPLGGDHSRISAQHEHAQRRPRLDRDAADAFHALQPSVPHPPPHLSSRFRQALFFRHPHRRPKCHRPHAPLQPKRSIRTASQSHARLTRNPTPVKAPPAEAPPGRIALPRQPARSFAGPTRPFHFVRTYAVRTSDTSPDAVPAAAARQSPQTLSRRPADTLRPLGRKKRPASCERCRSSPNGIARHAVFRQPLFITRFVPNGSFSTSARS